MSQKVRLGGMALANGVLVHGPTAWACAVRTPEGEIRIASARKGTGMVARFDQPLVRGLVRLVDAFAVLPRVRRRLPEARFPFEQRSVLVAVLGTGVAVRALRASRLGPAARELLAAGLSIIPAAVALRGTELAGYHGAEHVAIGSYEHGEERPKEHERCGSHLIGPMLLASMVGSSLAERAPERHRRLARALAGVGGVAAATELFGWMVRNPQHPAARALAWPGAQLQERLVTAEPSPEQLEVAAAALHACLELEDVAPA